MKLNANTIFANPPLVLDLQAVLRLVEQHFCVSGTLVSLVGERDLNYLLTCDNGQRFVVKISHQDDNPHVLFFQSEAMAHIAKTAPDLPIPREMQTRKGCANVALISDGGKTRYLRVISYLDGIPLHRVSRTQQTRAGVGRHAAELGLALRTFSHPADEHHLIWDMKHVRDLAPHIAMLPDQQKKYAQVFMDRFCNNVLPAQATFRQQVIHNDLNLHNLHVDDQGRVVGCFDFGDMVRTALVFDLAVAAAYQVDVAGDAIGSIVEMAKAYHETSPLNENEIFNLVDLVAMRFVLTLAITHWRAGLHPSNANYILRNAASAAAGLEALAAVPQALARAQLRDQLAGA